MKLPLNLTKKFSKALTPAKETNAQPKSMLGTVVKNGDNTFVILDGSTIETPVELAVDAEDGDRVAVQIKDHKATVVNNYSAPPSARTATNFMQLTEDGLVIRSSASGMSNSPIELLLDTSALTIRQWYNNHWINFLVLPAIGGFQRTRDIVLYDDFTSGQAAHNAITRSYGCPADAVCRSRIQRCDNFIQLLVEIKSNTSVDDSEDIFRGDIDAQLTPAQYATAVGYYGKHAIVGRLNTSGELIVRNSSSTPVTVSDGVLLSFVYILEDIS